jgi:hypothetical protein
VLIRPRSAAEAFSQIAMPGGPLFQKYGAYLDRVTVAQPPREFESRLRVMFPGAFENLCLRTLDPCDLALTNLEPNFQRDRTDVPYSARAIPFDLELLCDRYLQQLRAETLRSGFATMWSFSSSFRPVGRLSQGNVFEMIAGARRSLIHTEPVALSLECGGC